MGLVLCDMFKQVAGSPILKDTHMCRMDPRTGRSRCQTTMWWDVIQNATSIYQSFIKIFPFIVTHLTCFGFLLLLHHLDNNVFLLFSYVSVLLWMWILKWFLLLIIRPHLTRRWGKKPDFSSILRLSADKVAHWWKGIGPWLSHPKDGIVVCWCSPILALKITAIPVVCMQPVFIWKKYSICSRFKSVEKVLDLELLYFQLSWNHRL